MIIGILNFGEGLLWLNYLIFCTVAAWGALQIAAAQARLTGLMLFPTNISKWLGVVLVFGAYVWFFTVQPDLFIPGLAGGEFFTLFLMGFGFALLLALASGVLVNHVLARIGWQFPAAREQIKLRNGRKAELWLPTSSTFTHTDGEQALPPLVIALREAAIDSLDILSRELVAGGAAVLLCDQTEAEAILEFVEGNAGRFQPLHWYVMGVGRGADRALQLAGTTEKISAVLALAPFGRQENTRAGLRWLCEADYVTAVGITRHSGRPLPGGKIQVRNLPTNALVVYGDEDMLIRPAAARELYPSAVMVAGARHFTLAAMPATLQLASDLFEVRTAARAAVRPARTVTSVQGEASE